MKFKLDENCPVDAADIFIKAGFNADTVINEKLQGASDDKIYSKCQAENRILVTLDLDFSDIRKYSKDKSPGIIIIRLFKQDKNSMMQIIKQICQKLKEEPATGKLWIVEENRIRIR